MIYSDITATSLVSATNTAIGTAIDSRGKQNLFAQHFVTGGSAIVNVQASLNQAQWVAVSTVTATNGVAGIFTALGHLPYIRAHSSGYAGATATVLLSMGVA
jgi:hypothetical protein